MSGQDIIAEHVELIILFGIVAFAINWIALSKNFFVLPHSVKEKFAQLTFKPVIVVFSIYVLTMVLIMPLLAKGFYLLSHFSQLEIPPSKMMGWMQFFGILFALFFITLYCSKLDRTMIKKIWKDRSHPYFSSIYFDAGIGVLSWIISFPIVAFVSQTVDLILYLFFGFVSYEQVAVKYLKFALESPYMLASALTIILFAAPILEELLFRGFLQTWLKKHLGTKASILVAALLFAIFHLSPSQGLGNLSLGASLFLLACFLGFIYERQGSLFAPIALHMTFNSVSAIRILLMPES